MEIEHRDEHDDRTLHSVERDEVASRPSPRGAR